MEFRCVGSLREYTGIPQLELRQIGRFRISAWIGAKKAILSVSIRHTRLSMAVIMGIGSAVIRRIGVGRGAR